MPCNTEFQQPPDLPAIFNPNVRDDDWYSLNGDEKESLRVLVVEDDSYDFILIKRYLLRLSSYDVSIDHAQTTAEAREAALRAHYDIVLVDFCLGEDTGVLAMDAFGGRNSDSVIILLTGMPGPEIQKIALKAGAVHCMSKNQLNSAILEATITSTLHNHRLEKALVKSVKDLEAATNAKSEFFASMSHDLKTPLNAILGYAEIISGNCLDLPLPEAYRDYADKIRSGGLHLLEVINNLVLHASDMTETVGGQFEQTELNELAGKAVEIVSILAKNKDIQLDLAEQPDDLFVHCQPSLITQALVNLISNAVKYTENGGHITVKVNSHDLFHSITVEDDGIGMNAEEIEIALSPFGRCKLPSHLSQEGTGLGLSIVDRIVTGHGGTLRVDSSPGNGTSVAIELKQG